MSKNIAAILRSVELAKQQRVRRRHTAPVVPAIDPDEESFTSFKAFLAEDDDNFIPDPAGQHREPKSIYSPAPSGRIKFERPVKRKPAERNQRDCELPPDPRRRHTFTIEDANGTARGVVRINQYAKRIAVSGFGLVERKP